MWILGEVIDEQSLAYRVNWREQITIPPCMHCISFIHFNDITQSTNVNKFPKPHQCAHLTPPSPALVARVCYCFFLFVCLEFLIIWFVISTFTPIFFIEISFVLLPPPPLNPRCSTVLTSSWLRPPRNGLLEQKPWPSRLAIEGFTLARKRSVKY